jgi:septal ring factor EnvC (AmiA/AmiB activator)
VKTVDPESSLLSKAGIAISQSSEKLLQAEMALQAREVTLEQTIEQRVASLRVEDAKTLAEIASTKSENEKLKIELAQMELDLRAREVRLANDRQVVEQMLTDANRLNEEGQNMLLSVAGLPGREEVAA